MTTSKLSTKHSLFYSVYLEEEQLRLTSLSFTAHDDEVKAELLTVEQAARLLVAIKHQYTVANEDDGLIIHLLVRLVNLTFSSIKLALSGYYQQSFALTRDITETGSLVHYLIKFPSEIPIWRKCTDKERKQKYSPVKIRNALDISEGTFDLSRAKVYAAASDLGAHASPRSFNLLRSNDTVMVGPFFAADYLRLCVRELFMRLCPVPHIITAYLNDLPDELQAFDRTFLQHFVEVAITHKILTVEE